jgi:DNA (cytosine-5)-methyltransferase 1
VPVEEKTKRSVNRTAVPSHRGPLLRLGPSSDSPDPKDLAAVHRWRKSLSGPTAIDLFCGAGGLSLGLKHAGFSVLVGADSDEMAIETHTASVGGMGYTGDLSDPTDFLEHLEGWGIEQVDLLAGGVPCQPFSRAGQAKLRDLVRTGARAVDDHRASLWRSFMKVVAELNPRVVVVENVPELPVWDEGAVLIGFLESFRDLGYAVTARVIDCFEYGVPQHRARLFIVATRNVGPFSWPEPRRVRTTLRDAIGDLPVVPAGQRHEKLRYRARHPLTPFQKRMRSGLAPEARTIVHDHITRAVRYDDWEAYGELDEGQTYADLPHHLRRYRSDIFTDKYKRLSWDELSRTITAHLAKDGYWYIHPEQHRTLSIREAARLQTFPDHVRFAGAPSHRYRQIGNAVPPMMAESIGRSVIAALEGPVEPGVQSSSPTGVRQDLLNWHHRNARSFPWRASDYDPWHVLMAEICLHRARADHVAPAFEALLEIAPTPHALVIDADGSLAAMKQLGLVSRAKDLIKVARALVDELDGQIPDTDLELRMLPGVGDYVSQAVLCFGFRRRATLIDTNTSRIVGRLMGRDTIRRWQLRLDLYGIAGEDGPDAAFNYALLDLGALVCKSSDPDCGICPLRETCAMGSGGEAATAVAVSEEAMCISER